MIKSQSSNIIKFLLLLLLGSSFVGCIVDKAISLSSKPHQKQYLINRNYMSELGLNSSVNILDIKKGQADSIKAIHIGTPENTTVYNYITFNDNGDVLSINKQKEDASTLNVLNFKYDKINRLTWIIPNLDYFVMLDYDSIQLQYDKWNKPHYAIAMKDKKPLWRDEIQFDDKNGEYIFTRKLNNKVVSNTYRYSNDQLAAEYHQSKIADNRIDSVKYFYIDDKLTGRIGIFDSSTIYNTSYDTQGRPQSNIFKFIRTDSVAWQDNYFYTQDSKIPYCITTVSPMGWQDEVFYYWE